MNKLFYSLLAVALSFTTALGQCEIDYDFGDLEWGISPDASLGETFETGIVMEDYYDVLHMLVPVLASDIDPTYPPTLPIDSLVLVNVTFIDTITLAEYTPDELGLEYICNNNGDSGNPCSFLGGSQYCASIQGVPTMPGIFRVKLDVNGWITWNGPFMVPESFDTFILNVQCDLIEDIETTAGNSETGETGSIDVILVDGVTDTSFEWYDANGNLVGTTEDIDGLEPGIYDLVMTGNGCTSNFDNIIIEDASIDCNLEADFSITDTDEGVNGGTIDLTVTGANGTPSFVWTDENGFMISADEDLTNVGVGVYEVTITDEDGCVLILDNLDIDLGLDEMNAAVVWDMLPNPANEDFTITSASTGLKNVVIRDVQGRILFNTTFSSTEKINVSGWDRGFYFVTVSTDHTQSTRRLVVNH